MSALLLIATLALNESQIANDSTQGRGMKQCRAGIASKVRGELSDLSIAKTRRIGRITILNGGVTVLQRPPSRPGEMTPTHVIQLRYYYECRWSGRGKANIKLLSQNN
ncbi:MAG: hypothetical protein QOH04_1064 [Sphingomonadales bacterium]|jgi:hypothetical protein|nr:hypothetical protein [Sphingomonadales bacterium]